MDRYCEETPATEVQHGNQAYLNLYAVMDGFVTGVAPHYVMDEDHPPMPNSPEPANALFGRFMGMLIDQEGNMTPYANQFFSAMASEMSYDCKSAQANSPDESCISSGPGRYWIMIKNRRSSSSSYEMLIVNDPSGEVTAVSEPETPAAGTPVTETFSGNLSRGQESHLGPFDSNGSEFTVNVTGNGDVDLYVKKGSKPSYRSFDCRPYRLGSDESCRLSGPGRYYVMIMCDDYRSQYEVQVTYSQ